MFTGIIKEIGEVKKAIKKSGSLFLTIKTPRGWNIKTGDSIATDGVCLTVKKVKKSEYETELMPETLNKTYFGKKVPKHVNLERSLTLNQMLDGHLVLGHVDAIGKITSIQPKGNSKVYTFSFPSKFKKLVAAKGSIAVDGISLTVVDIIKSRFSVSLVEYTLSHTTIGTKKVGDLVNLEFDIIAKYLNKIVVAKK